MTNPDPTSSAAKARKKHSRMPVELETLSDYGKCLHVFTAVCEGKDCELTYHELEALQEHGYITDLKKVRENRWVFEWTDKLRDFALSPQARQDELLRQEIANQSD